MDLPPAEAERSAQDLLERARRLLAGGDAAAACGVLEQAVTQAPQHLPAWLGLAAALRALKRHDDEMRALERALAIDPTHLVVLLQKAALLDLMQKPRSAAAIYGHALSTLATGTRLPPGVEAHVRHAEQRVRQNAQALADTVDTRLSRAGGDGSSVRFERFFDALVGRKRIFTPAPTATLFPYLRNYEFFEREAFPWLQALEAAGDSIREEFLAVLSQDQPGIAPYIAFNAGLPLHQWRDLNHSRRWSAYFLCNQSRREDAHLARCPSTAAALAKVPQVDIPGRGPTAFFSILDAHTHIPAHSGVTNTRLTVHLPLVVPPGCRFRVGGETREWREGTAWVFDDTIEHEAWNDSDLPRAILIFDVWNPELTARERDLVRETTVALNEYYATEGEVPGVMI
jgi:aspartate beta-hydroxylase